MGGRPRETGPASKGGLAGGAPGPKGLRDRSDPAVGAPRAPLHPGHGERTVIKPAAQRTSDPRLLSGALFHWGIFHQMQTISLREGSKASFHLETPLRLPGPGS